MTLPQIKITQILKRVNYITQTLNNITAHLTRRPHLIIYEDLIYFSKFNLQTIILENFKDWNEKKVKYLQDSRKFIYRNDKGF